MLKISWHKYDRILFQPDRTKPLCLKYRWNYQLISDCATTFILILSNSKSSSIHLCMVCINHDSCHKGAIYISQFIEHINKLIY